MEEKIKNRDVEFKINKYRDLILNDKDKEEKLEELVFYKMIELINQNSSYMFGAQKAVTARFISKHRVDVYNILKEILKRGFK
ncbi:MAG: hypothetical protein EU535_05135 [Promethearchaeota archaeon]|nr:MAG: hypothetical protein EU535_05135 [Candidatus Lokiarchaeota archaeon]